ncbi:DUF1289 domain-containing protein [Roseburia inulinivorans DSM 16841]|nr:DUF1289 domain-containing protein [Roseburia inulinivorans DSM 16841]
MYDTKRSECTGCKRSVDEGSRWGDLKNGSVQHKG